MGTRKRPKLATHYDGPRAGSRDLVSLDGRCRIGDADEEDIVVLDLDRRGCRVRGIMRAVSKGDPIFLTIGPVGPIEARLRWMKRGLAGLKILTPLSDEQFDEATAGVPAEAAYQPIASPE